MQAQRPVQLVQALEAARAFVARIPHRPALGLPPFIAESEDACVTVDAWIARDPEVLGVLRRDLRSRMRASPLTDALRRTRAVEHACRSI